ncbi:MAG: hypothetical protein EBS38_08575, partial [Actinobacteria bacterium]|nr:hypothetical protein [Actinomycetota bacterium]
EVIASGWSDADNSTFYTLLNTYLQALKKTTITLTRISDGDSNDLFFWLGTNGYSQDWANPAPNANPTAPTNYTNNAHCFLTASTYGGGNIFALCDRTTTSFFTNNVSGSWVKVDLGTGRSLSCSNYSIRNPNVSTDALRNWVLEGSNDDTNWTTVDSRTSDTSLSGSGAWANFTCNQGVTTSFRYWRIRQTGLNSSSQNTLYMGEFTPYGTLTITNPTTFTLGSFGDQSDIFYALGRLSALSWTNAWVNPAASGIVTVTASSVDPAGGNVSMLTDRTRSDFYTNNVANSWVQFDFGSRTVRLDAYQLRNYGFAINIIRSWRVRGSNDGSAWTDLDIRNNDATLTAAHQYGQWTCNQGNTSFWRYIRIEQTGLDSSSQNYLGLGEVAFGGAIA